MDRFTIVAPQRLSHFSTEIGRQSALSGKKLVQAAPAIGTLVAL
jgi:hypothetical protein